MTNKNDSLDEYRLRKREKVSRSLIVKAIRNVANHYGANGNETSNYISGAFNDLASLIEDADEVE